MVQHVGKALGQVWQRCAHTPEGRAALKGFRHLLVRPAQTLRAEQEQARAALAAAFPDLAVAWQAKQALRTWYASATAQCAVAGLDAWVAAGERDGPDELHQAFSAFHTWRAEILAFFRFLPTCLTNSIVEGKHNRTKALMRQAYGYRNRRHLRLRILIKIA